MNLYIQLITDFLILVLAKREEEFSARLSHRASFQGFTALHYAVLVDSFPTVKALLDNGADPLIVDHAGREPIHYAAEGETKKLLASVSEKVTYKS